MRTRHTFTATILVALLAVAGVTAAIAADPADPPPPRIAFVANGVVPADALAAGPIAGQLGAPVYTTPQDALPEATRDALAAYNPELVIIMGGTVAISDDVVNAIATATGLPTVAPTPPPTTGVVRAAGQDRYTTATIVADLLSAYDPAYLGVDLQAIDAATLQEMAPAQLSVQGYEQVFGEPVTLADPGDIDSAEATCPEGKAILGGGHTTTDGVYTVEVFRSRPIDDRTWQATAENISPSSNRTFGAFAICAVVNP